MRFGGMSLAHWKALFLIAVLIPATSAAKGDRHIKCEQPKDKIMERVCTVPEIMALVDEYQIAWERNVRGLSGEILISIQEDGRTAYAHLSQYCWYNLIPRPSEGAMDSCIIKYLRLKIGVLTTKILTPLPDNYGFIVAREFGWAMPLTDEGQNRIIPPGIKSQGIVFYPELTNPRFAGWLNIPHDIDALIDTSRSLEVDFDILDIKPESLSFRYLSRQKTLAGEIRSWETLKTLDLIGVSK